MGNFIKQLRDRIVTFFNGLSKNKKIILIGGISGAVILLTILILVFTRTDYVVVVQGLSPADAQVVTAKLDEVGIPWKSTNDATSVSVPEDSVSKARMELAASVSSTAFSWNDVFSNESITMTSQTREQMYIQATAADVEQSIETISSVEDATVILQIPKESSYFIKDEIESKASVVLKLKAGQELNEEQVNGIVNLIVSSVKDLKSDHVTVLDASGIQLNNPDDTGFTSVNNQFEMQQNVQQQLKNDLTVFLENIYGLGNAVVQPKVLLDFNQQSETQKIFNPPIEGDTQGIIRSATRITEDVVNDAGATGVAGTDSNTGEATSTVEGDNNGSSYKKASETLNYELNEIYREVVKSQGDVKQLSIGVLLNTKSLVDGQMTEEHKAELTNLIAMSAGTDPANIQIMVQEFPDPMEYYNVYTGQGTEGTLFGIPIFVIVIVVLVTVVAVIVVMIIVSRNKKKREEAEALALKEAEEVKTLDEIEFQEDKGSPKYHIEKFVDTNPEAAAALLRAWLNDN